MTLLPVLIALFITPAAAALVFADASRRGLSHRRRTVWTIGVGLVSFAGFLGAALLDAGVIATYYGLLDRQVAAVTPLELLARIVAFGVAVTVLAVLGYGLASRFGPFAPS